MGVGGKSHAPAALPPGNDPVPFVQEAHVSVMKQYTSGPGWDCVSVVREQVKCCRLVCFLGVRLEAWD
jgi:hypothetical protein